MSKELLLITLQKEKQVRKQNKESKNFSWVIFFAGEEYNQELANNSEIQPKINLIDLEKANQQSGEWIENKLKEIYNNSQNKSLIEAQGYPIIWFKNLEKIIPYSDLEKSLLPVFDHQQNTKLFNEEMDFSNFILVATSSTRQMGKLSPPLISRLECINITTAEPKKFFLDKYFNWILSGSILLTFFLLVIIFFRINKTNRKREK